MVNRPKTKEKIECKFSIEIISFGFKSFSQSSNIHTQVFLMKILIGYMENLKLNKCQHKQVRHVLRSLYQGSSALSETRIFKLSYCVILSFLSMRIFSIELLKQSQPTYGHDSSGKHLSICEIFLQFYSIDSVPNLFEYWHISNKIIKHRKKNQDIVDIVNKKHVEQFCW